MARARRHCGAADRDDPVSLAPYDGLRVGRAARVRQRRDRSPQHAHWCPTKTPRAMPAIRIGCTLRRRADRSAPEFTRTPASTILVQGTGQSQRRAIAGAIAGIEWSTVGPLERIDTITVVFERRRHYPDGYSDRAAYSFTPEPSARPPALLSPDARIRVSVGAFRSIPIHELMSTTWYLTELARWGSIVTPPFAIALFLVGAVERRSSHRAASQ